MQGRHIAITGCTSGIGQASAIELGRRGARLTLFCRNHEKGKQVAKAIIQAGGQAPRIILIDMSSLDSVRRAAAEFLAAEPSLDVLLNNAGVVNKTRRVSADGYEEMLAVNHFAPFLLTGLLLPALRKGDKPRIVNVASGAYLFVREMGFDDIQAPNGYRTFWKQYGRSKLANILFTRSLAQRLKGEGITVNCLHPGAVSTGLGLQDSDLINRIVPVLMKPFIRSPEQGAETSIYLCCSDEVAGTTGQYFYNSKPKGLKHWAKDDAAAARLWSYTEECVGFRYDIPGTYP
jgi:NAD(P)-dependent dehydrogenase (short-subunit alcohol dehydrogenase family)